MINIDTPPIIPAFPMTLAITSLNDPKARLQITPTAHVIADRLQLISMRQAMLVDPSPEGTPADDFLRLLDEAIEEIEWLYYW